MGNKVAELGKISKCVLLSFIVTIILCGIFAAAVSVWQIEESTSKTVVSVLMVISVIFGAFVLAKNLEHAGLLNGLIMAIMYFATLVLISFIINGKFSLDAGNITRLVIIAAAGMLGGILGINT